MLKKSEVLKEGYIKGLKKAQSIITEMMSPEVDAEGVAKKCIDYLFDSGEVENMDEEQFLDAIYTNFIEEMTDTHHLSEQEAEDAWQEVEEFVYSEPRVEKFGKEAKLLDTDGRYSYDEIQEWLDENDANWDSFGQTEEGSMLQGDFFIFVDGVGKWLYATEYALNDWSSCYKVKFFDEIPQELYDKASEYLDYVEKRGY